MNVMKYALAATVTLTMLLTTACAPSNATGTSAKTTLGQVFKAPNEVFAPTITGDSPAQPWTFPNDPAKVIREVHTWLSTATVTKVHIPKNPNLQFEDYIGPADLYFVDESGSRIKVAPAYYIAHGSHGYYPKLIKNVISYKDGRVTTYLKCPQLFQWLGNDKSWGQEFRMESYTPADKKVIAEVKASKWGGRFTSLFPDTPGIDYKTIPHGGPAPAKGTKSRKLWGTVETLVDPDGPNKKVTFIEVWNNGQGEHRWVCVVSPKGTILSHSESGKTAPQDWQ